MSATSDMSVDPPAGLDAAGSAAPPVDPVGAPTSGGTIAGGTAAHTVLVAAAVVAAGALAYRMSAVLITGWSTPSTFDDAYMFCRYADHLLAGEGMTWNVGGPSTYGCTSLLYTFWIAAIRAVTDMPFWRVTLVASVAAGIMALPVMAWSCRRVAATPACARWSAAILFVAVALLFRPGYFYHAGTGMDTTCAILTNALVVVAALRLRRSAPVRVIITTALLGYIAFLTRPDSLIYVTLFPLLLILFRSADRTRRRADALRFAVTLGVLLALDTLIKWRVFSHPLPIPFYAKSRAFYEGYIGAVLWNPVSFTRYFVTHNIVAAGVIVLAYRTAAWRVVVAALVPVVLTFAYFATVMQIMGFAARFYYPALPFVMVSAYAVLDAWFDQPRRRPVSSATRSQPVGWSILTRLGALGLLLIALFPAAVWAEGWYKHRARRLHPDLGVSGLYEPARSAPLMNKPFGVVLQMAALVNDCPPETVWAMSEHGYISAAAPDVRILDLAGLHDPASITGTNVIARLFARCPDVIWFPTRNYTGMITSIKTHDVFVRDYDYWPGAFEWGIAVYRNSPHREKIMQALDRAWRDFYGQPLPSSARWTGRPVGAVRSTANPSGRGGL